MDTAMHRFLALFAFALAGPVAALAQDARPVLIELFASQNCPACPKAHKTMQELTAERDDIFVLTWSVDYWDYLGEPDPMSLKESKIRQAIYAENLGLRAPYTPQSVYDGVKQCPGTRRQDVVTNISKRQAAIKTGMPQLTLSKSGSVTIIGACEAPLDVSVVEYLSGADNRTNMVNPVTRLEKLGVCDTEGKTYSPNCKSSCAVLLHAPDHGEVVSLLILDSPRTTTLP